MIQTKKTFHVHIRWMVRRDMPNVLAIENESFEYPWTEDNFVMVLRRRNCIAMVAEVDERIVGFMVYDLYKNNLQLRNIAVDPDCRYRGVGKSMIEKLRSKLVEGRRSRIVMKVRETNLNGQLFLKACGFRCDGILPSSGDFPEAQPDDEPGYLFVMRFRRT